MISTQFLLKSFFLKGLLLYVYYILLVYMVSRVMLISLTCVFFQYPLNNGVPSTKSGGYFGASINVGAKTRDVCMEQFYCI